ncbi:NmrA family transcriptional regulator [Deinococcus irradiatisoli]|uniref:NmrA family transcriptional regulator n=1 Tax=Deinococcus irradiatisoli TaxID=2202254 RepID=A0A2Z3JNX0_9DEIO|nr:NAD(P)H-binding protein [Deinococcus irradiatisoli]AWN22854.1 NmrA family transcriptional regulator [Deinococcus irradiatisoli]
MSRPRILVMTAAGKTGSLIAAQLLAEGFPVTAFVRREDARSARLRGLGAEVVAGSQSDLRDLRRAMSGVRRAYFNTPLEPGALRAAAAFATVARETRLEALVVMSQWLASPTHPSVHTRETWLADRLFAALPGTAVTTLNPGFFADNDFASLAFAAQFGVLMLPYGQGRNAPPSNEDLARVAAEILARPEAHAGRTYRPTGPVLRSPTELAAALSTVLGRRVRYLDTPLRLFSKVARGMGQPDFVTAQYEQYAREYQRGTFALGAPTSVVRDITGRDAEDFPQIARRYVQAPEAQRRLGTQVRLLLRAAVWMGRPAGSAALHLALGDFAAARPSLSADSAEWTGEHPPIRPVLLAGD